MIATEAIDAETDFVVVVVVVGAAYCTILFSVTINIYISITINYKPT